MLSAPIASGRVSWYRLAGLRCTRLQGTDLADTGICANSVVLAQSLAFLMWS